MADAIDAAQAAAETNTEDALAAHKARRDAHTRKQQRIAESHRPYDPTKPRHCAGCDDVIDVRRLALYSMTGLCTPCAALMEKTLRENARCRV